MIPSIVLLGNLLVDDVVHADGTTRMGQAGGAAAVRCSWRDSVGVAQGAAVKGLCEYGDEVARALADKAPVVALETTVVTHGLPHPDGVTTALSLQQILRDAGATPATIGIIGGAIRIGLTPVELEQLVTTPHVAKINLSNLAAAVASGQPGSTTVAATMFAAHAGGIRVFATGASAACIASGSGDISADLTALSRIPVAVVSAGAKAILDCRARWRCSKRSACRCWVGTDEFPAFYRRSTGLPVDCRYDRCTELASAVPTHFALGSARRCSIANPIPDDRRNGVVSSTIARSTPRSRRRRRGASVAARSHPSCSTGCTR